MIPTGFMGGMAGGATVNVIIRGVDQFGGTFDKAYTKLTRLQKVGKVAKVAIAGLAIAMTAVGVSSLKAAAEFEVTKKSFEVMLGSAKRGQQMLEDLAEFTKKTPFKLTELETSARMMMGMGVEAEKVIPTMKSLGDVAAGLGIEFDRVALNFGQVKSQGRLMGTELRDFSRAGIPIIAELAKNLNVAESAIKDMASAGDISFDMVEEAFRTMSSEGGQFANLMQMQMGTAKGQISNLQDAVQQMQRGIGEELLPTMKTLTETVMENKDAWAGLAGTLGTMFGGALKIVSFAIRELIELGDRLAISLQAAAELIANPLKGKQISEKWKAEMLLSDMGVGPEQRMGISEQQMKQIGSGDLDAQTIRQMVEANDNYIKSQEKNIEVTETQETANYSLQDSTVEATETTAGLSIATATFAKTAIDSARTINQASSYAASGGAQKWTGKAAEAKHAQFTAAAQARDASTGTRSSGSFAELGGGGGTRAGVESNVGYDESSGTFMTVGDIKESGGNVGKAVNLYNSFYNQANPKIVAQDLANEMANQGMV